MGGRYRRISPDPNPSRALAFHVEPQIPLEDLPCFVPGPSGAGVVLDLSRVFLDIGSSCAVGSRHEIACALGWIASKVPPRPGSGALNSWRGGGVGQSLTCRNRVATRVSGWGDRNFAWSKIRVCCSPDDHSL